MWVSSVPKIIVLLIENKAKGRNKKTCQGKFIEFCNFEILDSFMKQFFIENT